MTKHPKRPRDPAQLAKFIVDLATGNVESGTTSDKKNQAAVALGRLGGKRGGAARAAKKAASKRWAAKVDKG